jgi:hypothetical protein
MTTRARGLPQATRDGASIFPPRVRVNYFP